MSFSPMSSGSPNGSGGGGMTRGTVVVVVLGTVVVDVVAAVPPQGVDDPAVNAEVREQLLAGRLQVDRGGRRHRAGGSVVAKVVDGRLATRAALTGPGKR